jgi:hypothetical protein
MHAESTTAPPQRHHELICGTQATALGDQAAVPPQHGAGRDEPVFSQRGWQVPDEGGEDCTVGSVQPGPGMGAAQHGNLVPQHE